MKKAISVSALCILLFALVAQTPAYAWAETDYIMDYNYDNPYQPIPKAYTLINTIFYLGGEYGTMSSPQDLFIDENDTLYVADTGNNRIIKFDENFRVEKVFGSQDDVHLNNPQGVFVDADGGIFVADTGNNRILKLSKSGRYVEEFERPESDVLPKDFVMVPRRVAVSPTGYLYAIRYQWIMQMDAYNNFRGYINTTEVAFNLGYYIRRALSNEKQKQSLQKLEPASCLSFDVAKDGTLYVTTVDSSAQLKKISSINKNVYPKKDMFGYVVNVDGEPKMPYFIDLAVTDDEIVFMLESWAGEIHVYDSEGNNLAIFGGLGDSVDEFTTPVAVDTDSKGNVYVLDSASNSVKVFAPTRFMQLVMEAVKLYSAGDYVKAVEYWDQVSRINANYALANKGFAKAYYKQKQWDKSMYYYKLCGDKKGYSTAFAKYRLKILHDHFLLVVICAAAVVAVLILIIRYVMRLISRIIRRYYSRI